MIIESKYAIGDRVFKIVSMRKEVTSDCPFCVGGGFIRGANGEQRACPKCFGRRNQTEWNPQAWQVPLENGILTIGQVRVLVTNQSRKEEYMCHETGIGSGTLHSVDDFFETHEAAVAECAVRNEKMSVDAERLVSATVIQP